MIALRSRISGLLEPVFDCLRYMYGVAPKEPEPLMEAQQRLLYVEAS
jgi:hypothetical protein